MLTLTIKATELFNEETQRFINIKEDTTLHLEHSLVSLSKWEQTWEIPFLGSAVKTNAQIVDYIRCMTLDDNIPPGNFNAISDEQLSQVSDYINAKMTATWFSDKSEVKGSSSSEVVTSEILYYWLIALTIPFEVQHWHLNSLLTLIRVTNIKNDPDKKMMPKQDAATEQRELNAQRKAQYNTKG